MKKIQTHEFDFTLESNQQELENWKNGVATIPFPKDSYWIDGYDMSKQEEMETVFNVVYEYLETVTDQDVWFWIIVLFLKNGTARLDYLANYSSGDENLLAPVVNSILTEMGLDPLVSFHDIAGGTGRKFPTWQEAYEFLCDAARKTKIPPLIPVE